MQRILSMMMVWLIALFTTACHKSLTSIPTNLQLQVQQTHAPFQGTNYVHCERCLHFFKLKHNNKEPHHGKTNVSS